MNKIILTSILLFTSHNYLECMKRLSDSSLTTIQPNKKIKKEKEENYFPPIQLQSLPLSTLADCQGLLTEKHDRLLFLQEELNKSIVQFSYVNAIQQKSTTGIWNALAYGVKVSCLDFAVAVGFTPAIDIILKNTHPTPRELNASLRMAIGEQNIDLTKALLEKGAQLTLQNKPLHALLKKVLNQNSVIAHLLVEHNIKLVDAVKMELEEVIKIILERTQPDQSELDESLDIAAQQQNESLATLLIIAGANIASCIQ